MNMLEITSSNIVGKLAALAKCWFGADPILQPWKLPRGTSKIGRVKNLLPTSQKKGCLVGSPIHGIMIAPNKLLSRTPCNQQKLLKWVWHPVGSGPWFFGRPTGTKNFCNGVIMWYFQPPSHCKIMIPGRDGNKITEIQKYLKPPVRVWSLFLVFLLCKYSCDLMSRFNARAAGKIRQPPCVPPGNDEIFPILPGEQPVELGDHLLQRWPSCTFWKSLHGWSQSGLKPWNFYIYNFKTSILYMFKQQQYIAVYIYIHYHQRSSIPESRNFGHGFGAGRC